MAPSSSGLFVLGTMLSLALAACGDGPQSNLLSKGDNQTATGPDGKGGATNPDGTPANTPAAQAAAAQAACAGVATPTTLSDAKDIHDVRIVGSAVFFQSGTKVVRVAKDGSGAKDVYTSPNLIRAYVDQNAIIAIESNDNNPDATVKVIPAISKPGAPFPEFLDTAAPPADPPADPPPPAVATTNTNFNAAGTQVFASTDTSFYVQADTDNGDALVKFDKAAPGTQTTLANSANVIGHPQLVGNDIWYVRDQQRVYKVAIDGAGDDKAPVEMFGIGYATCELAVNDTAAFCSVGTAVERRDLKGGNPKTILDASSSKFTSRFGQLFAHDTTLYMPSDQPAPAVKNVIVAISSASGNADQKFVACGRNLVTAVAIDGSSVVWTEQGGGVFLAPK